MKKILFATPIILGTSFLLLGDVGCPPEPAPPIPPQPVSSCRADSSWITSPTQPNEVASAESFCDFYQFSWQWFLAQASPSPQSGEPVFFQNRVYDPTGQKDQCSQQPVTGLLGAQKALSARGIKPQKFEEVEADGHALYDQQGNILYYNALYSEALCHSTDQGFVPGTLEVKVSWMVLPEGAHHSYFTMNAQLPDRAEPVTLGLVGFHMAIWTPNHPEMIWATWEHKQNTPLCDGSSKVQSYNFASKDASECLAKEKSSDKCSQYNFNTPHASEPGVSTPRKADPIHVCREYAFGNQKGKSINGNDNQANVLAIRELNAQLVGDKGILSVLSDEDPMKVWSNYEMVGALWTKNGQDSGKAPIPSKAGPGDATSPQRGSLELSNMTMETFQQGDTSFVPNCFGCHNYTSTSPLSVSHIQQNLK